MNKLLIDTNILVYAIDKDSKYNSRAIELLNDPKYDLYTTSKNLSEFFVVLTKGKEVIVTINQSIEILENLLQNFIILYPSEKTYLKFRELLLRYNPKGLLIHDFEIACIALENEIDQVATINTKDFINIAEITLIDF